MNKTFPLTPDSVPDITAVLITVAELGEKHIVHIRPATETLSDKQRKLYWKWLTVIGNDLGESKEYYHKYFKKKFLINIYSQEEDFARMIEAVREVHRKGMKDNAVFLYERIVKMTSITDATVSQMAEYLNAIDNDASGLGIILPRPDNHNILEYQELKGKPDATCDKD